MGERDLARFFRLASPVSSRSRIASHGRRRICRSGTNDVERYDSAQRLRIMAHAAIVTTHRTGLEGAANIRRADVLSLRPLLRSSSTGPISATDFTEHGGFHRRRLFLFEL